MTIVKTLVIWLVKLFKLEEVFLSEFKALLRAKINAKLANLENIVSSIEKSGNIVTEVEDKMGSLIHHLAGKPFDAFKNEFNVIESGISGLKTELENDLKELA